MIAVALWLAPKMIVGFTFVEADSNKTRFAIRKAPIHVKDKKKSITIKLRGNGKKASEKRRKITVNAPYATR